MAEAMSKKILGYDVVEELFRSRTTLIYRARHQASGAPVVLKVARGSEDELSQEQRLRREHALLTQLAELQDVIAPVAIGRADGQWVMALEDIGGASLASAVQARPLAAGDFLPIAVRVAAALARIHAADVIHKDLNPGNIVLNRGTGELRIIDFGLSTRLQRSTERFESPSAIQGTLPYISPEQTGRMNRPVDFRTDLYSLGATFYHLLAGRAPFDSSDPIELVHAHLARVPRPLSELAPEAPPALVSIVERLMCKDPDARYQSADGLRFDLEECLRRHRADLPGDFPLGRRDTPTSLMLPERLYGRASQTGQLLAAFERAAGGEAELVLVAGFPGVGKSALVHELYAPITARRGFFVSGKFDQLQRDVPYAVVIRALRELTGQLLRAPERELLRWKALLLEALGVNGAVLIEVIPELEHVIGPQPPAAALSSSEARNRLHRTFSRFISVFARPEHPLVLFLDDLQWVDPGSLRLIEGVLTSGVVSHLLVIGAYRDSEVAAGHPLLLSVTRLAQAALPVSTVHLPSLSRAAVQQLIADTVRQPAEATAELSGLVRAKTGGNPFFVRQLIGELYAERLLRIVHGAWIWDTDAIRARRISSNVVELVTGRMRALDDDVQAALQTAGALGGEFDLGTLAIARGESPDRTWRALRPAVDVGLLIALSDDYERLELPPEAGDVAGDAAGAAAGDVSLRFSHDRIQQAAYTLADEAARVTGHWRIGRRLLEAWTAEGAGARLFDVVGHLNTGRRHAVGQEARDELAALNLRAARRAGASAAFAAAYEHAGVGIQLLGEDAAERRYETAMALLDVCVETAYQTGDFEGMEGWYQRLVAAARTPLDAARADQIKTEAFNAMGRPLDALAHALASLEKLGVALPPSPGHAEVVAEMSAAAALVEGRSIDDLAAAPDIEDPSIRSAVELICKVYSSAYVASPYTFAVITLRQLQLVVQHGNCAASALSYAVYGLLLAGLADDVEGAYRYGALSSRMLSRPDIKRFEAQARHLFSCHTRMWREHLRDCADGEREAWRVGLETGELEFGAYGGHVASKYALFHGEPLQPLRAEMAQYTTAMQRYRQDIALSSHLPWHQAATTLIDGAAEPHRLTGALYDAAAARPELEAHNNRMAISNALTAELVLAFLFERFDEAVAAGGEGAGFLDAVLSQFNQPLHLFFDAMARLARWDDTPADERPAQRTIIDAATDRLSGWARSAALNLEQKVTLLRAELLRIDGDPQGARELYDRAITQARRNDFLLDEAVAYEVAARFYLASERAWLAQHYLTDARNAYARWGADAKVAAMEARHPTLAPSAPDNLGGLMSKHSTVGTTSPHSALDLDTLLRAAETISSEVVLSKLLERLVTTLLESAGAERAVLVLLDNGRPRVEAMGSADGTVEVLMARDLDGEGAPALPSSLYNYAVRTGRSAVVDDASTSSRFAHDAYVSARGTRSAMCVPIKSQGRVIGAVYLENDQIAGAFGAGRAELVNLLAGQIAVSIENARLYTSLERRVAERTAQLEDRNGFIRQVFGRYMSDEVVHTLLESREGLSLGGERRVVTLMFTDLRGFTAMCEHLTPEQAVRTLNNCLSVVTRVVHQHQGNIDNIMGDGLLVLFGAPLWREDDADRAVACAVALQLAMAEVNALNAAEGLPALTLGIGVHTGEVVAGNIGSKQRAKYSVIGRNANIASRVEASAAGGQVLVSEATVQATRAPLQLAGQHELRAKGMRVPLTVYELRGVEGAPELQLSDPTDEARRPLDPPAPIRVREVRGKSLAEQVTAGALVAIGRRSLALALSVDVRPGTDLAIETARGVVYVKIAAAGQPAIALITGGDPELLLPDPRPSA